MKKHQDHVGLMRAMFDAAVKAALPIHNLPHFIPEPPKGRTIVVGAGKAAGSMAQVFEQSFKGKFIGLVVTRYGHSVACKKIEVVEAAHPIPDEAGEKAAARILELVSGLNKDDLVVVLLSGGGSSLLSLPAKDISLTDKKEVNRALLKSGATIDEINCVRKHISRIKGGRLAAAAFPAKILSIWISDIPGDDLAMVASGPTMPDLTTFEDARSIVKKYDIQLPESVRKHLREASDETPKPNSLIFENHVGYGIASPQISLEAAAEIAKKNGYTPIILGDAIEGEAREVGIVMAGIAMQARRFGQPIKPPCAIISGGETTVTVKGNGVGGRNVEFLLSLAIKLNGAQGIHALAGDTDGVDGAREVAGAYITPETLAFARSLSIDPWTSLSNNDAHNFFAATQSQIITGPTLTNVNDFRVILVE